MSWAHLKNGHQLTYGGRVWYLEPTPKARHPWVLTTETPASTKRPHYGPATSRIEIGRQDLEEAMHAAETWLELSKYCA